MDFRFEIVCKLNDGSHDEIHVCFFGKTKKDAIRIWNKCANYLDNGIGISNPESKITASDEGFSYQPLKLNENETSKKE